MPKTTEEQILELQKELAEANKKISFLARAISGKDFAPGSSEFDAVPGGGIIKHLDILKIRFENSQL